MEMIRKAVIREDLLSITDDFKEAIILNQFIYWSERIKDADILIEKENEIARNYGEEEKEPSYGWFYKNAEELSVEVMLGISKSQIGRYVNRLVEKGFIQKRNNPKYKWDRTLQYKVNLVNIARALKRNGYPLSDYKMELPEDDSCTYETPKLHGCNINVESVNNQSCAHEQAIPETTNTNNKNIDYNTENTKVDTFQKEKFKAETSFSKEKGSSGYKKTYSELVVAEQQMVNRIYELCKSHFKFDLLKSGKAARCLSHYFDKYTERTGKIHPIYENNTLIDIIGTLDEQITTDFHSWESLLEFDEETINAVIDEYFERDYGKYRPKPNDYHLKLFASGNILAPLMEKIVGI